jgi:mRNA-degrading endonuclease YafQ of YafQ-DinJ toxin-antitoxin module
MEAFANTDNHQSLKVHKLNGPQKHQHGFSVNYKIRIVFTFISTEEAVLTAIGSHKIYK